MPYLVLLVEKNGQKLKDYVEVTSEQEVKITGLINDKRLPVEFSISGTKIVNDTILGFCDELPTPKWTFDTFSESVKSQPWYQRVQNRKSLNLS
jgi:hypothetical protein